MLKSKVAKKNKKKANFCTDKRGCGGIEANAERCLRLQWKMGFAGGWSRLAFVSFMP